MGELAVSRAIGDHNLRQFGVIPHPELTRVVSAPDPAHITSSSSPPLLLQESQGPEHEPLKDPATPTGYPAAASAGTAQHGEGAGGQANVRRACATSCGAPLPPLEDDGLRDVPVLLILATDGLWDMMSSEESGALALRALRQLEASEKTEGALEAEGERQEASPARPAAGARWQGRLPRPEQQQVEQQPVQADAEGCGGPSPPIDGSIGGDSAASNCKEAGPVAPVAVTAAQSRQRLQAVGAVLVREALSRGSRDNVTVTVVDLRPCVPACAS
jgi:serine/threonine protein phosphatase PrpC